MFFILNDMNAQNIQVKNQLANFTYEDYIAYKCFKGFTLLYSICEFGIFELLKKSKSNQKFEGLIE